MQVKISSEGLAERRDQFSTITRTCHFRFDYFTDLPISYIFFYYNTDFAIFAYLWDWFFEDLSVPPSKRGNNA